MKNKNLLKHKRNRHYEEITKEFSEAGLNLSEIKIEDFAESRKKEIFKFQEILNNKYSTKSGHQLLPKHMRRRQMSHNPFRIPRKNRLSNLTVNVKSKCHKHKRKLKNLKQSYIRRATKQNWLENHLWLAKRFVMKKFLDYYTIPYKRRDKGYKACYKYWEYESIISDISYYDYFIVTCENIRNFLNEIKEKHIILNINFEKEFKCYEFDIYDKGNLIGPVKIWFYKKFVFIMNISFISKDIKDLLGSFKGIDFKFTHYINAFIISGKKSLEKIFNIFKSCENDNFKYANLINKNKFIDYFEKCEDGYMEVFKLNQPTSQFRMNELIFRNCLNEQNNSINENDNINTSYMKSNSFIEDFLKIFIDHSKIPTDELLSSTDKSLIEFQNFTERTTFMHRKKVDLKSLNNKISQSIKNKKNKDNKIELIQTKKDYPKDKKIDLKSKDMTSNSKIQTYFCLIKKNIYYKEGNDIKYKELYIILFQRGFCSDLFRRFVYLNTKAIGMKDLERYMTQYNQINFPKDYPGTIIYKKYIIDKTKRILSKYFKKPPSKRVNYQHILNPSPFYPSWNYTNNQTIVKSLDDNLNNIILIPSVNCLLNQEILKKIIHLSKNDNEQNNIYLLCINFLTIQQGIPKYNDLICLPNEDDITLYIKFMENKINLNKNLFSNLNINDSIIDLNTFDNMNKKFYIEEEFHKNNKKDKNKDFNVELLSILDYYNSNYSKKIENKIINTDLTININSITSRIIIGFVTTGLYDYSLNKGKGIAYIQLNQFAKIINLKKKFNLSFIPLLLRSKNSKNYYLIQIND